MSLLYTITERRSCKCLPRIGKQNLGYVLVGSGPRRKSSINERSDWVLERTNEDYIPRTFGLVRLLYPALYIELATVGSGGHQNIRVNMESLPTPCEMIGAYEACNAANIESSTCDSFNRIRIDLQSFYTAFQEPSFGGEEGDNTNIL